MRAIAIPLAWFAGIAAVALAGLKPDPYLEHVRHIPPPHQYPAFTVLWIGIFITGQAGLVLAILRPASYRHSWGRALLGLLASVGFLAFGIFGAMHAPRPHAMYLLWLLAFSGSMLLVFAWSAIGAARSTADT
jgi:hypothetical protein